MKRILFIPLLTFLLASSLSFGQEHSKTRFGLGWYSMSAPVGGRVLINNKVGIDLGLGYAEFRLAVAVSELLEDLARGGNRLRLRRHRERIELVRQVDSQRARADAHRRQHYMSHFIGLVIHVPELPTLHAPATHFETRFAALQSRICEMLYR